MTNTSPVVVESKGVGTFSLDSIIDKTIRNNQKAVPVFEPLHVVLNPEPVPAKPAVVAKPAAITPVKKNKYPLQGLSVKAVALILRTVIKHFKYGMTKDEQKEFVTIVAAQSHCPKGTAAGIAKVFEGHIN